jgi:hypothetical protein
MAKSLQAAIDAAVRAVDKARAAEMRASDGEPAALYLDQLRADLLEMRTRGTVDPEELRAMIRSVAAWAPEDDVSLLAALGAIARVRSR